MTRASQPNDRDARGPARTPEPRGGTQAEPARPPGHAPGGGELDSIPDDQARKVVPDDPRQTAARDPSDKPWPDGHDAPDDAGDRPRPL
ncbi:TPA: hypothetical protein QDA99_004683 [Burkholderia vietnamiensis]|uniref:hypothetical protein n=1 Tax=Burkholderia sp. MBR-1 TaxID=2732364 RepID=UPI0015EE4EC6|nr:hypothetical protein [Burkholderia sp. MBR-1]QMI48796.1 hypothetical protein MBR110_25240 [Burkholderia sp. MBR-1]HDR9005065.1 hypothetical protein [Burkholderia vietnamiensis]HDR9255266.1 hypothetical protein [Burkholderia vietnamiensis]